MRKRIIAGLCTFFVIFLLIANAGAATVYFTAVNDVLFDLEEETMPVSIGGDMYVPYSVFNNTTLRINYIYDRNSQKFTLYRGDTRLSFNMATGMAYDQDGSSYSKKAVMRNSRIFVPVEFVCSIFGLTYSYITESSLGVIIRITNEDVYLSNSVFATGAYYLMQAHLNAYVSDHPEVTQTQPTQTSTSPPTNSGDVKVFVSFQGINESTAGILDTLEEYGCKATFFVTADEIRENPDLMRRISGTGHSIGIYCEEDIAGEYSEASSLLFDAARLKTLVITTPSGEGIDEAEELGLILWSHPDAAGGYVYSDITYRSLSNRIDKKEKRADMRFQCSEEIGQVFDLVLDFLTDSGYNVKRITETDTPYVSQQGG